MTSSHLHRSPAAFVAIGLLACAVASAQYVSDFEMPGFAGSPNGTLMTGQDGFYIPQGTDSVDYLVFTYADNTLGIPPNPIGGEQFVAGTGPGSPTFARAQRDMSWGPVLGWVGYDVAVTYVESPPSADFIGSFSVQPYPDSAGYLQLFSWVDPDLADNWNAFYLAYDASGTAFPYPGAIPGPEWENLELNHWYRFWTSIDFEANRIIEVTIVDLNTGISTVFNPTDWFLAGGEVGGMPTATAFRFFAGGGAPGNTVAWDNLSISFCRADVDNDGDVDLEDLALLLSGYGLMSGATHDQGDLDWDGDVDLRDLALLLSDYHQPCR